VEDPEDYEWRLKSKVQGVLLVKSCKDISFDQLLFMFAGLRENGQLKYPEARTPRKKNHNKP